MVFTQSKASSLDRADKLLPLSTLPTAIPGYSIVNRTFFSVDFLQMAHYTLLAESSETPNKRYDDHDSSASDRHIFLEKDLPVRTQKSFYRQHFKSIIFHSVFCTFNLLFCFAIWHWAEEGCPFGVYGPGLVYSKPDPKARNVS